ncbi:hypothetical protein BGZ65_003245 [Modicella reniformis]|uniref:Poly(A) RNA polymerase mitochondrial-like central palm domain-containing protein n=1 Tax=Modicella reniformis TaxID=1440133 RepID=A0A9P6IZV8_9FUNG|nr:hypothetical protein BGZ65_003245 [Modicella reniformis]
MAKEKAARDAQRATKEAVGEVARGVRQAAKAKEERIAKEQAEKACISRNRAVRAAEDAKRAVQAQIERVAREKAENDRLRAEQAAEEAKRAVRAQIERIARGKAEAERIAREKAEQATKAEAERQAKEIAELIAKTEADRLAREEATRLKKEEDARMAKQEAETRVANKKEQEAHLLILEEDIRQAGKRVEDALQTKKEVAQEYRQQLEIQTQAERFKADRMDEIAAMRRDEQAKAEAQARSDAWKLGRSYGEKYDQAAKARKTIEERIERLKADRYEEIAETHLAAKASGEGNTAQAVEGLEEQFKKDMEVTNKELELANKACEEASKAQRNLQAQMHADEQCETKRIKDQAEARKQQEEMDKVKLKQADNEAAALAKSRGEPIRLANRGAVFFDWQGLNFTLSLWKQSGHWGSMESTLNQWFLGLLCSKGAYDTRCAFLGRLQQIFYTEFPGQGLELKPFGSFITGLGNDWSDLDICIYSADFQPNAPHSNVVYLAEFLRNCMMENVIEIPDAKVPIVRFVDPITHISCDMNIQHTLGIHNSSLIQTYLSIDPRLREFLIVLKYFAKCHGILDASLGYLNSYAYNLMGIVFFQEQREAILPRLQSKEARPRSYNTLGKSRKRMPDFGSCLDNGSIANQQVSEAGIIYDCSFDTRIDAYKSYGFLNKKTVAQLLFEFFEFFSRRFDYRTMEVSAINGRIQERLSLQNGKKQQIETAISDFAAQNRGISPTCVFDSKRKLWLSAAEQAYFKDLEEHGGMPSGMVPIPGVASASLTLNPVKPVAPPRGGHYDRFGNEAFLCVADPFIVSRNVAGACRGDRLAKVWRCFDHAYKCLGQGNITEAFQPLDLGGH